MRAGDPATLSIRATPGNPRHFGCRRLLRADGAAFAVEPAEPPADDFNAPNPGARLLFATIVAPADGVLRFAVVLTPGKAATAAPILSPLDTWSQADGPDPNSTPP